ncbi:MAG: VIT1/CCC1 transporter family protein [Planctomycetota bacterium]|nr:VIT1/CCC1 transporter family protein [Planctomycetota bacterium]
MSTTATQDPKAIHHWQHHLHDEADAAFLYRELESAEADPQRREVFRRLAEVEDRHVGMWRRVLSDHGVNVHAPKPSARARLMAWLARRFGPGVLLSALLREEGEEVKSYLALHKTSTPGTAKETALTLAQESAQHAETLKDLTGHEGEPWHKIASGGFLRNVVYGFNDGLTANFGLLAGVVGAIDPEHVHIVIVSGVAGAIADALSMGSSGYLAAKSEREVYEHEIEMEKEEMRLMPEVEEEELALIYEAKGIEREQAQRMARDVMSDPKKALEEKVREELKIGDAGTTPMRDGLITGFATLIGALIPVAPFLVLPGLWALWTSFAVSMLSHFGVGAARSFFTGRGIFRSGIDMFAVGLGIAAVGYGVGVLIERVL